MRRVRIAAPAQLTLGITDFALGPVERWWSLPVEAQKTVIVLLARMIAAGVVEIDGEVSAGVER